MQWSDLFRMANILNPTTRGRLAVRDLSRRFGARPRDGIYRSPPGFDVELRTNNSIDISIYFDAYEPLICDLIRRRVPENGVFIDIGANIGYLSLIASKAVGPSGRVLSFEPHPDTFKRLLRNIEINSTANITTYNFALSDEVGESELFSPHDGHHGGTSMKNQGWNNDADTFVISLKRLDDILPEDIHDVSFIKVDVEGAEILAFRGSRKTIEKFRPDILFEYQPGTAARFGYHPIQIPTEILEICPEYEINLIPNNHGLVPVTLEELSKMDFTRGDILLSCR